MRVDGAERRPGRREHFSCLGSSRTTPGCALNHFRIASALLPNCFRTASALLPHCFRTASALLPHCFRTASALLSNCFRTASALLSNCWRNGSPPPSDQDLADKPKFHRQPPAAALPGFVGFVNWFRGRSRGRRFSIWSNMGPKINSKAERAVRLELGVQSVKDGRCKRAEILALSRACGGSTSGMHAHVRTDGMTAAILLLLSRPSSALRRARGYLSGDRRSKSTQPTAQRSPTNATLTLAWLAFAEEATTR